MRAARSGVLVGYALPLGQPDSRSTPVFVVSPARALSRSSLASIPAVGGGREPRRPREYDKPSRGAALRF